MPEELPSELSGLAQNIGLLLNRVAVTRRREQDFIRHAELLETGRKTSLKLGKLVKRLSGLARIGQSVSFVTQEPLGPDTLLDECIEPFCPAFEKQGLNILRMRLKASQLAFGGTTDCRGCVTSAPSSSGRRYEWPRWTN